MSYNLYGGFVCVILKTGQKFYLPKDEVYCYDENCAHDGVLPDDEVLHLENYHLVRSNGTCEALLGAGGTLIRCCSPLKGQEIQDSPLKAL